ncbi:hypothetical protein AB0M39_38155 [Streptomyces sp. NPDC051907]|uniref:hypothetical protein n=1 Tax=Streptomyces sp. NPDC051907 TaxID=3155284 RepID=UPI003433B96A
MGEAPAEPVENRPWRPQDGPPPRVWTWPRRDPPTLQVWSKGRWRRATVLARQDWADRTVYQVEVDLEGNHLVRSRLYAWPQPGLKAGRRSSSPPSPVGARARPPAAP